MNQLERDKRAIRGVLASRKDATYSEIALAAGENLADALIEMVRNGEVERLNPIIGRGCPYRLTAWNLIPNREKPSKS